MYVHLPHLWRSSRENRIIMSTITLALSLSLPLSLSRALGHAANRGKVYLLHPELFKVR